MVTVPIPSSEDSEELLRGREYLRLLRKSLIRIKDVTSDLIEPHGLTGPQMLCLLWIRDSVGLTQVELAAELDSDPNTVSAMIRRMIAKGFIMREKHPTDGRAHRVSVTKKGRALLDEAQPDVDRLSLHLFELMKTFDENEIVPWLEAISQIRSVP
jgi:DNA-binding MarR family transcriptional regulator